MTNNSIVYQVDAFTDQAFRGNPAGVMLVDATLDETWMQQMAAEMNLSETAYVIPKDDAFEIRYFTPKVEIPLCGHATLASAHILYQLGIKKENETILFHAKGGDLLVSKEGDWISMNFPAYPVTQIEIPLHFKDNLGFQPLETYSSSYGWIIGIAASEEEILSAQPNFEHMKSNGLGHLMITAPGKNVDYVVRCFAPSAGINEDPVTGSAQCALVPLWHLKTGKTTFAALQLSERTGELNVKLINDRVEIQGKCRTIFKATLEI
ncbi:MAG: phenazine biosynthesis protein PhzF [Cytophagaceae bacterium]|jgi:PhzF family phenazine biosynthesis protein|nr:phenazine biosynthesis protein PhzF [Cytophagaceae bacterium]